MGTHLLAGHLVCFGAVALGLAALLARFNSAITVIRVVGALYLVYLGLRVLLAQPRTPPQLGADDSAPAHHGIALQGLLAQLTNPKNLLFVLALLPQFIRPDHPLLLQLAIMLAVTMIIDGVVRK